MAFTDKLIIGGSNSNPQTPSGTINGTNKVFTANDPVNNLYLNEGFQTPNVDYTTTKSGGVVTITFTVAPPKGSIIYST